MPQPIEVHYWPTPNGRKVTIALEEMGLPYEILHVNIGAGEQFKPEFLAISPNNRMPAIVDPEGPDGKPISVFESGAILQYLARKTGKFYGETERERVEIEQWLMWQMGGLGPMAGQSNHFRAYAPQFLKDQRSVAYGANRYTNEVHRLYGVLNRRLEGREFVAGPYSIADFAIYPWTIAHANHGIDPKEFPHFKAWFERIGIRPAVVKGAAVPGRPASSAGLRGTPEEQAAARAVLFGQRAR